MLVRGIYEAHEQFRSTLPKTMWKDELMARSYVDLCDKRKLFEWTENEKRC